MVQFRLDGAFASAESWKPENRSAWDMLLPRTYVVSFISLGVSLSGSILWCSFVGRSGACANDIEPTVGAGLVEVKNPMNYGLKGGFPVQNPKVMTEIYSISMFHQLYCLVRQTLIP